MRRGFSRDRKGRINVRVDPSELLVLDDLVQQLYALVKPESSENDDPLAAMVGIESTATEHDDPAMQRLFPQAYPDDAAASDDFRRFTERSLREEKVERAHIVQVGISRLTAEGGQGQIPADEVPAWLGTLNNLRLVLASRVGVSDDEGLWRRQIEHDPELVQGAMIYDWLTWLQDSLVTVIHP